MPDQPQRLNAFAALCRDGHYGAHPGRPGIVLSVHRALTMIDLRGDPRHAEFLASARAALEMELPLAPNTTAAGPGGTVLWLGPDQWLLVGERYSETLPIAGGFLTDVSHGRAGVRVSGTHVRDVLAKSCALDLHPRVFAVGRCAQTSIARVSVLLHCTGGGTDFELYCARSYAGHVWHWLTEASGEFGYEVRT